jgi:hypothetical protein
MLRLGVVTKEFGLSSADGSDGSDTRVSSDAKRTSGGWQEGVLHVTLYRGRWVLWTGKRSRAFDGLEP